MSKLTAKSIATAFAVVFAMILVAPVEAKVSPEYFAAQPAAFAPSLSPSGRYLAVPKRRADKTVGITVLDLEAPPNAPDQTTVLPAGVYFRSVQWGNDDRMLVSFMILGPKKTPIYRTVALDRDGKNIKILFNNMRRMRRMANLSNIVHPLPHDQSSVLIAAYDTSERLGLYKVDVVSGEAQLVQRGNSDTFRWLTDLNGIARARWDYDDGSDTMEIFLRQGDGDDWVSVSKYGKDDLPDLTLVGFGDDPRIALVASRQSGDRYAIYEYDTVTRALGKQVFQHATVDVGDPVGGPIYDVYNTKLLGVYYVEDSVERHFFEPELERIERKLAVTLPGESSINPISWSEDRKRFVFVTTGPRNPGAYYLYDTAKDELTKLGMRYPGLPPSELGEVLILKYKARDGATIPAYVTMPPGKGSKKLPLIVMPHGGPELRDYVRYDQWAQMLANHGYAVLQPNFRGSGGYGRKFTEAGERQWGRLMQDDVTDGVKALIADGTADPNRICIVGASYGGYAALAGGAFTPDLYKCVVSIAGIADLPEFVTDRGREFTTESKSYKIWVQRIGDPVVNADAMNAVSPSFNAANFKAPVLLIHGDKDEIVPIEQSIRMEKALKAAGKQVAFLTVEDEGHNFAAEESDIKVMWEMVRFLSTHLGPN